MAIEHKLLMTLIVVLVIAYQIYVSRKVYVSDHYTQNQRILQLSIIWLMPGIGAVLTHFALGAINADEAAADQPYEGSDDYDGHDSGYGDGGDGGGD